MGKKLFIGVPIHGSVNPDFFKSMMQFTQENKSPVVMSYCIGDSAVARSRNSLTAKFLATDCTDMLFIDSDLVFSAEQVARILDHDVDVVGGLYPKKQQGPTEWVINTMDYPGETRPDKLFEVKYVGTGFIKVSRRVFEIMLQKLSAEIEYVSDADHKSIEWDFWRMGVYEYPNGLRRWLSEDWWFCQMWRDLGGKVWADQQIVLKHSGSAVYPLATQEKELFRQCQAQPVTPAVAGDAAFPTTVPAAEFSSARAMQPA
jgi:hypothetical protein